MSAFDPKRTLSTSGSDKIITSTRLSLRARSIRNHITRKDRYGGALLGPVSLLWPSVLRVGPFTVEVIVDARDLLSRELNLRHVRVP